MGPGERGWDRPDWARRDLLRVRAGGPSKDQLVSLHHLTHMWSGASLVVQTVKNLPAMQKTRVQSLGQEDPLEECMQSTPLFLPGEFHGQRSLVGFRGVAQSQT